VAGLRAVQAGSCIVLGQQLRGAVEAQRIALRRRIGFVFQDHHLLGFLTAAQNVAMSLEPSVISGRERRARSGAILKAVGLGGHLDAIPDQLSGGQRQRVSIARALVREPELIIADEPTASLDSRSGREVVELIARLARIRKAAVLIVTHDLRILEVADRVVALEDGRISETSVHG
jgi:putative ABC transport system ATP-binding protein